MNVTKSERTPLITAKEAARLLGTTEKTLADWRCRRTRNLPFVKIGASVRYAIADIEAFIAANTDHAGASN